LIYARLSARDTKRCRSDVFALFASGPRRTLARRTNSKWSFEMPALTTLSSIAIAAMLGAALCMPCSIPAFSASLNLAMLNQAVPPLQNGSLVGLLATRKYISVDDDVDLTRRGPVVDFGLYYGPHIQFRHNKQGTTRGTGKNTLYLVSQIKRQFF
jgi:hypothetical protein